MKRTIQSTSISTMHLISLSKRKKMSTLTLLLLMFCHEQPCCFQNVPENKSAADLMRRTERVFLPSSPSSAVKRGPAQSGTFGSDDGGGGASTLSSCSRRPGRPVHSRTIPHLKTCDAVLIYDASQPLKFNFNLRRAPLIAP